MNQETVSLELLTVKEKRPLGIRLEKIIQEWIEKREFTYFYSSEQLAEMTKIVKEEMNIDVDFVIVNTVAINAKASVVQLPGHGGNTYAGPNTKPVTVVGRDVPNELRKIKIDLDKARVEGSIIDNFRNRITIYAGFVTSRAPEFTAEEITSAVLHELGHVFNQFMALGDYVWLNYYLQEGVDVLMGKKPNVYKLEILTEAGLEKLCDDKKAIAALKADPSVTNVRRAILLASTKAPRHHLTSKSNNTSKLREEQLADMFASRMGYARASVSVQAKLAKQPGASRYTLSTPAWVAIETVKTLLGIASIASGLMGVIFPPAWLLTSAFITASDAVSYSDPEYYDNDIERMKKWRRDLVAQLKVLGVDKHLEEKLLEDIKIVDDLIAEFRKHTSFWELFSHLLSPAHRRQRHQRVREEELESLLNNDLFVAAAKFNNLSRNA